MGDFEGNGRRRNRSRSRRHRNTSSVSSVSSRLDPDFDPRLHINNLDVHEKRLKLHDPDQELDPMTMEFETLVGFLHPTFIVDHLKKILEFLNSYCKELCFPNIAQYKETFLVKIANDNQRLMCAAFNDHCKMLGVQILKVVEENRNVYRWIHMYESGQASKNVLVYKKMFYNDRKFTISNELFKIPGIAPAPLAPKSKKQITFKTHQLTPSDCKLSKITFLNSTMKFLKQDSQLYLEYPQMTKEQAEIFNSVLCQYDAQTDIGFGYETLYAPLYKLMMEIAHKFEFKVTRNIVGEDAVRMTLRKIPTEQARHSEDYEMNYPQQAHPTRVTPSTNSWNEPSPRQKSSNKYRSRQRLVEALSESFVGTSLQAILDFIDDNKRASLEFDKMTAGESSFLQLVLNISRNVDKYATLFTDEILITFKKIARVLKYETQQMKRWRMNVNVGRLDRNKLGSVVFEKIPMMDAKMNRCVPGIAQKLMELSTKDDNQMTSSTSTTTSTRDVSSSTSMSMDSNVPDIAKRLMDLSTRDVSCVDTSLDHGSRPAVAANDPREGRTKSCTKDRSKEDRSLSRGRKRLDSKERRKASKYGISFQSAGDHIIDTTTLGAAPVDSCQTGARVTHQFGSGRKQRLLDDLSTPVEIDKAKRMMEQMGWDGGPLGARGEGITEPIMPAIHLAPGAGLGHTKAQSHSTSEFRIRFLKSVLDLIVGTELATSVCYQQPLTKREVRFIAPTVKSINKRKPLGLKLEEMDILKRILDEIIRQPTLLIECEVVDSCREIRIYKKEGDRSKIKTGNIYKGLATISTNHANIPNLQQIIPDGSADVITTEQILNTDIGIHCSNQRGYKKIAEKVTFLKRINAFLQIPDERKDYICDFILNTKQREYIHQVVTLINKRGGSNSFGTPAENALYSVIKRNINHCFMTVIFSGQKFTLHKRYYQKRFTNSSVDEIPVSKDVKRTIIYRDNTVTRLSGVKIETKHEDSEKHDKNTIVECKNEDKDCVVLSDQDDILLIDDDDLEDFDTDSETDKSDSKDTDENKNLESDFDISDDNVIRELMEKENEEYIVIDVDSDGDSDIDMSIDETNADTSKRDETSVDAEKNSITKESLITIDVSELDEVKMETGSNNDSVSTKDSLEIRVKHNNIEPISAKVTVVDETVELDTNDKNGDLNKLLRDHTLGSDDTGSNIEDDLADSPSRNHSLSLEIFDSLDSSKDEMSLTPPVIPNEDETHNIEDNNMHDSADQSNLNVTNETSEEETVKKCIKNPVEQHYDNLCLERIDLKAHAELEISVSSDEYMTENISIYNEEKLEESVQRISPNNTTEYRNIKFNETKTTKDVQGNKTSEVNNNFGIDNNRDLPVKEDQTNGVESEIVENDVCRNVAINNKYRENLALKRSISKDSILLESSPSSSKRSRSDSENSDKIFKKYTNSLPLSVCISHGDPIEKLGTEHARDIQKLISDNIQIDDPTSLPLLECQGLQNGGLIYNCYTDESLMWLKKVIDDNTDYHIETINSYLCEPKSFTLKMKLNSFIAEKNEDILRRIELYNTGLRINNWVVIDREVSESVIVLTVIMDCKSYQYVCENNFNLFAGVTKAQFYTI